MSGAHLWDVDNLDGLWSNRSIPNRERIELTDALILAMSIMLPPPFGIMIFAASRAVR